MVGLQPLSVEIAIFRSENPVGESVLGTTHFPHTPRRIWTPITQKDSLEKSNCVGKMSFTSYPLVVEAGPNVTWIEGLTLERSSIYPLVLDRGSTPHLPCRGATDTSVYSPWATKAAPQVLPKRLYVNSIKLEAQ